MTFYDGIDPYVADGICQHIHHGLVSEKGSMSEFDVPRKGRLQAVDVIPPDLTYRPALDREEAIDFPNSALHKLILISKYRDNSILRDEYVKS